MASAREPQGRYRTVWAVGWEQQYTGVFVVEHIFVRKAHADSFLESLPAWPEVGPSKRPWWRVKPLNLCEETQC